MKIYAGIGSRQTPPMCLVTFTILAARLEEFGYTLRSGGATGADSAFEAGVSDASNANIFLPWRGFNNNTSTLYEVCEDAFLIAAEFHPHWDRCGSAARKFHARNCYQVLGLHLDTPADFIVCWTPKGKVIGGTGQALRIAKAYNIPIFNFGHPGTRDILAAFVKRETACR